MQEDDKTETDTMEITKLNIFVNSFIVSGKKINIIKVTLRLWGRICPSSGMLLKYIDTIDEGKLHKVDEFCYYTPSSEH
jgi:hypothetical protein